MSRIQFASMDRDALQDAAIAGGPAWLQDTRDRSMDSFAESGLPTQKIEAWKYTSLSAIRNATFNLDDEAPGPPEKNAGLQIRFNSGRIVGVPENLPEGALLLSLTEALERMPDQVQPCLQEDFRDLPLTALNSALMRDGYVLILGPNVRLEGTVEIIHENGEGTDAHLIQPRNLILASAGSSVTVVERHTGEDVSAYFTNGVTRIDLDAGAAVRHMILQDEGSDSFHIANIRVSLSRDASYESFVYARGAALSRIETEVDLDDTGASCRMNGVYTMRGEGHSDITTRVNHLAPHTTSDQLFKGVLEDKARGVFQGRIHVAPDAQKISGHQHNKTILLSDRAEMDTKPQLEIFADDVKCSHGASIGELDAGALFYLRSRGLPEADARNFLIRAFLAETLETESFAGWSEEVQTSIDEWMLS